MIQQLLNIDTVEPYSFLLIGIKSLHFPKFAPVLTTFGDNLSNMFRHVSSYLQRFACWKWKASSIAPYHTSPLVMRSARCKISHSKPRSSAALACSKTWKAATSLGKLNPNHIVLLLLLDNEKVYPQHPSPTKKVHPRISRFNVPVGSPPNLI